MTTGKILRTKRGDQPAQQFSDKIGISDVYIYKIETDQKPLPIEHFDKFMEVYGFTPTERAELALHLANHGRINEQTRKYLKVEVRK